MATFHMTVYHHSLALQQCCRHYARSQLWVPAERSCKPSFASCKGSLAGSCSSSVAAASTTAQEQICLTDASRVVKYIQQQPKLAQLLGSQSELLVITELLDGVINMVFAVHNTQTGSSVLLKQALPYVRAIGPSMPLSRARMCVEGAAMQLLHDWCPHHIPELLFHDPAQSVLVMQYIPAPHQKLLYAIRQGQVFPELAESLSGLLATTLCNTSRQRMGADAHQAAVHAFSNNDIVRINEEVVLIHPFTPYHPSNHWSSPELDEDVKQLWGDAAVLAAAQDMLTIYQQRKDALIHNDLHAGNLLVAPGNVYLIDWEFATFGPAAFDLGCLMGNLLLAVACLPGMAGDRSHQQQWLLQDLLPEVWNLFVRKYQQQMNASDSSGHSKSSSQRNRRSDLQPCHEVAHDPSVVVPTSSDGTGSPSSGLDHQSRQAEHGFHHGLKPAWEQELLADSLGFAGCCMIRLVIGLHHYPEFKMMDDATRRINCERSCLRIGRTLLTERQQLAAGGIGVVQQLVSDLLQLSH
eukprot:jgi/Chrzof1/1337/Cz10g03140.t1